MRHISTIILLIVGLVNFYPLVGVVSNQAISDLYGISVDTAALEILLRHRVILFGLLGTFIIVSAFRPSLQLPACIGGIVSMVAFVLVAISVGGYDSRIQTIVNIDIAASLLLLLAMGSSIWARRNGT